MSGVSLFLVVGFITCMFSAGYFFERLLMTEYIEHRLDWERDDRPFGYYWIVLPVPEFPTFRSFRARAICFVRWIFISPQWVAYSAGARTSLWSFRVAWVMMLAFPLIWLCLNGRFI
jgi:hypothetical protein